MTEQYQVTIQSQLGPRKGILLLDCEGKQVMGALKLVGYVNGVQGVQMEDGTLHLSHMIQTKVSTFPCQTVLELHEGHLTGITISESARMQWEGILLKHES